MQITPGNISAVSFLGSNCIQLQEAVQHVMRTCGANVACTKPLESSVLWLWLRGHWAFPTFPSCPWVRRGTIHFILCHVHATWCEAPGLQCPGEIPSLSPTWAQLWSLRLSLLLTVAWQEKFFFFFLYLPKLQLSHEIIVSLSYLSKAFHIRVPKDAFNHSRGKACLNLIMIMSVTT